MSRLIIDNRSSCSDQSALAKVLQIVSYGRVSDGGRCYTYVTSFTDGVAVSAKRNKTSDSFVLWDEKK